jgi:pimeloyl-ACP methyl ester carboxylesterase
MKTLRKRPWALLLTTLLLMLSLTNIGCGGDEPVENDPETAGVTDDDEEEGQSEDEAQAADGEDEADADEVDEEAEDDSEAETDADADTATAEDEEADADEPAAGTDTDSDQADESEGDEGETAVSPADAGYTPNFTSSSCDFIVPGGRDVTCGYLTVPEDRTQPDGAAVRLHVAVFLSESGNPAPDPVVYLEGGPGGEPLETLIFTFEDYFAPYLTERDVIIFDQRGTGLSEPSLACPELVEASLEYLDDVLSDEEEADVYLGAMTDCRERLLADGVNLAAYNSRENAADLNDLRIALGYDEWNLYGISYGTKLALTTMRDFPEGIRSVVLDSAYPLQTSLIIDVPANMDRAFDTLFAGCAADTCL